MTNDDIALDVAFALIKRRGTLAGLMEEATTDSARIQAEYAKTNAYIDAMSKGEFHDLGSTFNEFYIVVEGDTIMIDFHSGRWREVSMMDAYMAAGHMSRSMRGAA